MVQYLHKTHSTIALTFFDRFADFSFHFRTHMQDLKDVTRDVHYENYRLQRIQSDQEAGITTTTNK